MISHLLPLPTEESSAGYITAQMSSDCMNAKLLIKLKFAAPLGTRALLGRQPASPRVTGTVALSPDPAVGGPESAADNTGLTPETTPTLPRAQISFMLERGRYLKSATFGGIVGWGNFSVKF